MGGSGFDVLESRPTPSKFVPLNEEASGVIPQAVLQEGKQKEALMVQKDPLVQGSKPAFALFCSSFLGVFFWGGGCKKLCIILWGVAHMLTCICHRLGHISVWG